MESKTQLKDTRKIEDVALDETFFYEGFKYTCTSEGFYSHSEDKIVEFEVSVIVEVTQL